MLGNTIGETPTATLQQVESSRLRERDQSETAVSTNTAQPQQTALADVEVNLSQEARDLSLTTVEQIAAPNQVDETQVTAVNEETATPPAEDEANEATSPPARESESQVTRQFDQSANEALGTVIDIRS